VILFQEELNPLSAVILLLMRSPVLNVPQGRRLKVAIGVTAPAPALQGALCFRPMSLSSYILQ